MKFLWRTKGVWFFALLGILFIFFIVVDIGKGDPWRTASDAAALIGSIMMITISYFNLKGENSSDKK